MATLRRQEKLICFKIVYCGSALSGKTTNLAQIHERLDPRGRGDLVSMSTSADRTLFFDFLALEADVVPGYRTLFQLYTVPGQMMYSATMNLVLQNADGIVFVVDSQVDRQRENVEAWQNLEAGLRLQQLSVDSIPVVVQYNKRDLPNAAPLDYLEYLFNNGPVRRMGYEAEAAKGRNVLATLNAVSQAALMQFQQQMAASPMPSDEGQQNHVQSWEQSEPAHSHERQLVGAG